MHFHAPGTLPLWVLGVQIMLLAKPDCPIQPQAQQYNGSHQTWLGWGTGGGYGKLACQEHFMSCGIWMMKCMHLINACSRTSWGPPASAQHEPARERVSRQKSKNKKITSGTRGQLLWGTFQYLGCQNWTTNHDSHSFFLSTSTFCKVVHPKNLCRKSFIGWSLKLSGMRSWARQNEQSMRHGSREKELSSAELLSRDKAGQKRPELLCVKQANVCT